MARVTERKEKSRGHGRPSKGCEDLKTSSICFEGEKAGDKMCCKTWNKTGINSLKLTRKYTIREDEAVTRVTATPVQAKQLPVIRLLWMMAANETSCVGGPAK